MFDLPTPFIDAKLSTTTSAAAEGAERSRAERRAELFAAHPAAADVAEFAADDGGALESALEARLREGGADFEISIAGTRHDGAAVIVAAKEARRHLTWAFRSGSLDGEPPGSFEMLSAMAARRLRCGGDVRAALDGAIWMWASAREGSDARAMSAAVAQSLS
jgi:hypothetical protein